MNCEELINYLLYMQARGVNLSETPVMYMEIENDKQVAHQVQEEDVKIVNVAKCNYEESPIMKTQFSDALLIGYVRKIDVDE